MEERHEPSKAPEKKRDSAPAARSERSPDALERLDAQSQSRQQFEAHVHSQLSQIEQRLQSTLDDTAPTRDELHELTRSLLANTAEMFRHQAQTSAEHAEQLAREAELQLAREMLARQQRERVDELRREREALDARAEELHTESMRIHQAQRALAEAEHEHREACDQLARRKARVEEQEIRLERELEELERRREDTRNQRQRIARQLRRERAELEEEMALLEDAKRTWNRRRSAPEAPAVQEPTVDPAVLEEIQRVLLEKDEELRRLAADLSRAEQQTGEFAAKIAQLEQENQQLLEQLRELPGSEANMEDVANLRMERLSLAARVRELEQTLVSTESQLADVSRKAQQVDDMQRRFEMAVEEMREVKRRNAELEDEFARRGGRTHATIAKPVDSWEATKKRLLAELQGDATGPAPLSEEDRLTVEGAIRITDEAVAQRDQEIAELKQKLAQALKSKSSTSSASAPSGQDDAETAQQRQHLRELEQEWSEKIRKAEVELSIERAKFARQRVQLEERIRNLEADLLSGTGRSAGTPDRGKKGGRRWLERLGLSGSEEEG